MSKSFSNGQKVYWISNINKIRSGTYVTDFTAQRGAMIIGKQDGRVHRIQHHNLHSKPPFIPEAKNDT